MRYLPVSLNLRGRPVVVIGGGKIAFHKCKLLLQAGARLRVVSPHLVSEFAEWLQHQSLQHVPRAYQDGDLEAQFLAVVATDDPAVQDAVAREAERRGVLVNVVDRPDLCTVVMPALLERDEIVIAVSTSGTCPGFAAALRDRIGNWLGPEYGTVLAIAGALRERWRSRGVPLSERKYRANLLLDEDFLSAVRRGDTAAVKRWVATIEGEEVELPLLGRLNP